MTTIPEHLIIGCEACGADSGQECSSDCIGMVALQDEVL